MSILSDTVRGVGRLLFPVRCPVCGGKMPPGSRVVCTRCRYAVPLTGFCYATYNPLWERLSALVPVRRPERLAGHHLLLVDDVLTTGATLLSCAETILRAAPDCRLSVAVLAVPQREFGLDG